MGKIIDNLLNFILGGLVFATIIALLILGNVIYDKSPLGEQNKFMDGQKFLNYLKTPSPTIIITPKTVQTPFPTESINNKYRFDNEFLTGYIEEYKYTGATQERKNQILVRMCDQIERSGKENIHQYIRDWLYIETNSMCNYK